MTLFSKLTNGMSSFQIEAKPIHNVWTWSIYRTKKTTFNPLCFNIHFAEETINGSHITITTAKLRLYTNYTPDLCNLLCNLLGNKLKKWFDDSVVHACTKSVYKAHEKSCTRISNYFSPVTILAWKKWIDSELL